MASSDNEVQHKEADAAPQIRDEVKNPIFNYVVRQKLDKSVKPWHKPQKYVSSSNVTSVEGTPNNSEGGEFISHFQFGETMDMQYDSQDEKTMSYPENDVKTEGGCTATASDVGGPSNEQNTLIPSVVENISPLNTQEELITNNVLKVKFRKTSNKAFSPRRAHLHEGECFAYELFSAHNYILPARERTLVNFDLQVTIPPNYYGRIVGRLTRSLVYSIIGADNVIWPGENVTLVMILFNLSRSNLIIGKGDRVGTLMLHEATRFDMVEV